MVKVLWSSDSMCRFCWQILKLAGHSGEEGVLHYMDVLLALPFIVANRGCHHFCLHTTQEFLRMAMYRVCDSCYRFSAAP